MESEHVIQKSDRVRAAGIVFRDGALLVMFRRKDGREYYTFPGGRVEEGESLEDAVVREIREETTVDVVVTTLRYELQRPFNTSRRNATEYFFACTNDGGDAKLGEGSIEQKINNQDKNFYEPRWVQLSDMGDIPLFPPEVATRLLHDLEEGFQSTPIVLESAPIL